MALAGVVSAFDSDVTMTNHRFQDLSLLAPEKLAKTVTHPPDRITDVWVLWRIEQIGERLPGRW